MSRKMQILRNILLIIAGLSLVLLYFIWKGYYFSKDSLFDRWEEIYHYGPAEKILLDYTTPEGKSMVFAKYEDRVGTMYCEKAGPFWKLAYGATVHVGHDNEKWKNGEGYQSGHIMAAYGWTPHEETKEVFFYMRENITDEKHLTDTVPVDRDGFFFKNYYDEYKDSEIIRGLVMMPYLEGRDAEGNVIWRSGNYMNGSAGKYKAVNVGESLKSSAPEIHIIDDRLTFDYSKTSMDIPAEPLEFEEKDGYITCLNHKFTVFSQSALMYTGSGPEGPALEGVEPGTVFASL